MNLSLKHYEVTVSIEGLSDDLDIFETVEQIGCLLLAAGFAQQSVRDGFRVWLEEHCADEKKTKEFEVE